MTVDALTRRALLITGGATAVAVVTAADAHAATPVFLHGVASGDPLPDGVLLWTRVTPSPAATPGFGPVAASLVQAANQHVKWAELEGHACGVLEIRPDACRMEWFHVRERTDRNTTARRVKAYAVNSGVSRLIVQ